jgi:DNA-binding response OmpR family regulator
MLSIMDGLIVLKEIRQHGIETPVILLTGNGGNEQKPSNQSNDGVPWTDLRP